MEEQLNSLLEFLHDGNPNVRQLALNHLLGYTVKSSQLQNIFKQNNMRPISDLKNICREDPVVAHDAFKALVNLTSDDEICKELNDDNFLHHMIKMITNSGIILADIACMLFSTKAIDQLVDVFVKGLNRAYNKEAEFHFLASVFTNVTMLPQGREYFLITASYEDVIPLSKLIVFTEHPNIIRRGGVISCLKNCCFATEHHSDMLSPSKVNILPYILLPLCGPEEFDLDDMEGMPEDIQFLPSDKKREPDAHLRQTLLETIVLLTTTRQGRMILRQKKVYPVIRQMHLVESDEKVSTVVDQIVNMLMRDEAPEEDNILEKIRSSRKRSWVWDHFKDLPTKHGSKGQCNVLKNDGTKCNHIIETDGGTGNFSYHLNITHGVTKFGKLILDNSQVSINEMLHQQFKDNVEYKEEVDNIVAEFLISDSQAFSVLENPAFKKLLKKFNPYYETPCDKVCNNINNNHEYLKVIIDVATRWDSTYIAWQLMKDLIKILQPFADATKLLGGSKYTTMSYMYPAISSLKKLLKITYNTQIDINLDDTNTVFDDDQEFQEEIDLIDEPELKLIKLPQICNGMIENVKIALFNALNYYWEYPIREALLATLLDPRNKKLEFATYSQRLEAEAYLVAEYEVFKEQELVPTNSVQIDILEEEENVFQVFDV
ncbi:1220_t:CDS:10 [Dentiscutata erythropus]|uniref:Protein HGH1 homolog n=1 Tax=Dentiscutata erythropus TaxID=1348616 RepID=A0A9N8WRK5_9GLOM|nr:1220_t:CDS:10 [Dentiscutata erythropus]